MIGAWVSNHVIRSDVYNLPFIIWSPLDKVIAISQTIFFKCIFENAKFCILMSSMTVSGIHLRAISYKVVKISLTCLLNYYFKIAVAYPWNNECDTVPNQLVSIMMFYWSPFQVTHASWPSGQLKAFHKEFISNRPYASHYKALVDDNDTNFADIEWLKADRLVRQNFLKLQLYMIGIQ